MLSGTKEDQDARRPAVRHRGPRRDLRRPDPACRRRPTILMPSRPPVRRSVMLPLRLAVAALLVAPPALPAQPPASAADQRLRALYEAEWDWRGKELGRPRGDGE